MPAIEVTDRPGFDRSLAQRRQALVYANEIRTYRAELKKDIAAGLKQAAPLLAEPVDERIATMKIYDLLLAVPGMGTVKTGVVLRSLAISPSKTVAGLSKRQRAALIERLVQGAPFGIAVSRGSRWAA